MEHPLIKQYPCTPAISHNWALLKGMLWAVTFGILVSGCTRPGIPTPTQAVDVLQPTSPSIPTISSTPTPLILYLPLVFLDYGSPEPTLTPSPSPVSTLGPSTSLPPTITPTPCKPPNGWVMYTVRANDTLFDLALKTNTTIAEIQNANCRDAGNTLIVVGMPLYLPTLPPTNTPLPISPTAISTTSIPKTSTPNPTITDTPTSSPTATPTHIPIVLAPGGGNDPGFTPCEIQRGSPWIDTDNDTFEVGQRQYFFACEFPEAIVQANVTLSDGSIQNALILSSMPNPVLQQGTADAVIVWSALPAQPTGMYSMTLIDNAGNQNDTPFPFWIELPTQEYILAVPAAGSPGTTFDIYYVNFDLNVTLEIELYREQSFDGTNYTFTYQSGWDVTITNPLAGLAGKGWFTHPLTTSPSEPLLAYLIHHQLSAYTIYWLK